MQRLEDGTFQETAKAGSGYELQEQAFSRLGDDVRREFNEKDSSGKIRQFAEAHKAELTPEEFEEFVGYADYIGFLFGFQGEVE